MRFYLSIATILWLCSGCAYTSSIVPMGPDTYTVTGSSEGGVGSAKEMALQKANAFAAEKKLQMIPVSDRVTSQFTFNSWGGTIHHYELTFRLVPPGDPENRRPMLQPVPNVVIDDRRRDQVQGDDRYDKLLKLKQLLDQKAISEEEYQAEKAKILAGE